MPMTVDIRITVVCFVWTRTQ